MVSGKGGHRYDVIVLGASTGGPKAVREVLAALPRDFPAGIAYVQHMEERYYPSYAEWLDGKIALHARLAGEDDFPRPGEVVVAPGGRHLVYRSGRLCLDDGPPVAGLRPCVDRLFVSAAENFGSRVIGVLLTGMGADGAAGCVEIMRRGGYTVAQDRETSVIFGMAESAIRQGGITIVLPLREIAKHLIHLTSD